MTELDPRHRWSRWTGRLILLATMVVLATTGGEPASDSGTNEVLDIEFCDLVSNAELHRGRIVRTRAIFHGGGGEVSWLYHPSCTGDAFNTWYEWVSPVEFVGVRRGRKKLRKVIREDGRAWIVVVGKFYGPIEIVIPEDASPDAVALLRQMEPRHGHMGCCKFMIDPIAIEHVEEVADDVPDLNWE